MSNIEYRTIIKFFTLKGLNATEITEELKEVYDESAPAYSTVAKWVAEFKDDPTRDFKDAPRSGRPSTTTTDENIKAVEHIVMRDRQISVRRVAAELNIPKTIVHEIMSNYLGMRKVCVRWVPKFLTPLQRANRVECCQELLQACELNSAQFLSRIVTGDETWVHHYDPLSHQEARVWKKSGEEIPTQSVRKRSAGKVMLVIFWDEDGVLLTDYLTGGKTMNGSYYASLIEQLHATILAKRHRKINHEVLVLHDNASVHKSNVVQAAIRKANFGEVNHPAYSPDIAPSDYYLFKNLKAFLRGKNFYSDDEVITTVEEHLNNLGSGFFFDGIQSLYNRWQRVVASEGYYIQ